MNPHWPTVPLGEILTPVSRPEKLDPMKEYRLLGVRLDGAGPFHRESKLGSQTSASTLSRVEAGDFIYSRLFAWRGAFGIISEDLDGCHVSGEFPTFTANPGKLDPKFLRYWFRRPTTLETVLADCTGSTPLTRNRFKEEFFLALEIPLPAVTEQRRIVARIEQLAAQIEEARRLRHQATEETEAFLIATARHVFNTSRGWTAGRIGDFMESISTGTTPPSKQEEFYGGNVEWFTPGDIGHAKWLRNSTRKLTAVALETRVARRFAKDTLLLTCIGEIGRVGICAQESSANQQITGLLFKPDVDPEFAYFRLAALKPDMEAAAPATTLPILNQGRLEEIPFSFPSLPEQRRIVGYLDGLAGPVAALARLQAATAAALDALLPSILDKAFKGEL